MNALSTPHIVHQHKLSPNKRIVLAVVITMGIGLGSGLTMGDTLQTWYPALNKPFYQPPAWVFGPVWTVLYLMMGIAAGLVLGRWGMPGTKGALMVYGAQLTLNAAWTLIFFGLRQPALALADIIALLFLILWCIVRFRRVRSVSAWLLAPYTLWVLFATLLNVGIVVLN